MGSGELGIQELIISIKLEGLTILYKFWKNGLDDGVHHRDSFNKKYYTAVYGVLRKN